MTTILSAAIVDAFTKYLSEGRARAHELSKEFAQEEYVARVAPVFAQVLRGELPFAPIPADRCMAEYLALAGACNDWRPFDAARGWLNAEALRFPFFDDASKRFGLREFYFDAEGVESFGGAEVVAACVHAYQAALAARIREARAAVPDASATDLLAVLDTPIVVNA